MPQWKPALSSVSSWQKSLVLPGVCTWWMPPPAARSPPGRSPGNPWSPAAPAREKSTVGSVGSVPEPGQEQSSLYGAKQDLWEAFSLCGSPQLPSVFSVQPYTLKTDKNRAADNRTAGNFCRLWLDLCFLMRWLGPDPCQVSVPLQEPGGSCWHSVNRPGLPWVPNWPWHENN